MTTQTLTIGKRKFVLIPERDFRRLEKQAGEREVRPRASSTVHPEFGLEAMRELQAYRKTGKATDWKDVKRRLGL